MKTFAIVTLAVLVGLSGDRFAAAQSSASPSRSTSAVSLKQVPFGKTPSGAAVTLTTSTNAHGLVLKTIDYGAYVVGVAVPDRQGKVAEITLGFDTFDEYLRHKAHFGGTVGRFGNRIAKGKFTLDGHEYQLATNNGPNHLHGGPAGFDFLMWKGEPIETADAVGMKYTLHSPDGQENYPGTLDASVSYTLTNNDELKMEYTAVTDKPTIINLTNHAYWNLKGRGLGDIADHELMLAADQYIPVDATAIPLGPIAPVAGTVMDFTSSKSIGAGMEKTDNGPGNPRGYDHCYVLRSQDGSLALAARVKEKSTGRVMEISTTEPGIQFYSGNFLDGDPINGGYKAHAALCLETQHYPDSPNQPKYPSTVLRPGQKYHQLTVHKFSVEK